MGRVIRVETVCQYGKCFKLLWAVQEKQGIQMSGNAPFFKPFFADFSIKMGESNRPEWVGILRFCHLTRANWFLT